MDNEYAALTSINLDPGTHCQQPDQNPELVYESNPAVDAMTDFVLVPPLGTGPDMPIGEALDKMRIDGVRLLLVTDPDGSVIGLITTRDIQGEKPIKLIQESGIPHADITVSMIMTPQRSITALNMVNVRNAKVGHIVKTLREQGRQHALVVEIDETTGQQSIRGMFSTTHIGRLLGHDIAAENLRQHSLAGIQHELA